MQLDLLSIKVHFISSLKVNSGLQFRYDGVKLELFWDTPFAPQETRNVQIEYTVDHPVTGLYFAGPTQELKNHPLYGILMDYL